MMKSEERGVKSEIASDFDVERIKKFLIAVRSISKYGLFFLFSCFIISFLVDFIHPLFWLSLFFGTLGVYGAVDIRIKEEMNEERGARSER
jgi:hypothetical protein